MEGSIKREVLKEIKKINICKGSVLMENVVNDEIGAKGILEMNWDKERAFCSR